MASVNKVILIGNLGRDPEVRYAPSGTAVCNFTIATSRQWKDKNSGERQEETEWHRIVCYDRMAENAGQYLKKGRPVYIEGRLKTRKFEQDGVDKYITEVIADQMQFLGSREDKEGGEGKPAPSTGSAYADAKSGRTKPPAAAKPQTGFDDMDDDIPFIVNTLMCEPAPGKVRRLRRASY